MTARTPYLAVGLGCAAGSSLRYLVSVASLAIAGPLFPWGTLIVNVLGSLLMGWLYARSQRRDNGLLTRMQPMLMAGFCGGFTTFSLFSLETLYLLKTGEPGLAVVYLVVSVPSWMLAVWLGYRLGSEDTSRNMTNGTR